MENNKVKKSISELVANYDTRSWIEHSNAQSSMNSILKYKKHYKSFIKLKSVVDAYVFKLSSSNAYSSASLLANASIYHDKAEQDYDQNKNLESTIFWKNVLKNLRKRYFFILLNYSIKENLNSFTFKNLSNHLSNHYLKVNYFYFFS